MKKTLISGIVLILFSFFQWEIENFLTVFLILPVWIAILSFTLYNVIILISKKEWKSLFVQAIIIIIWFFIPFTDITLNKDFKNNIKNREEVVYLIKKRIYTPIVSHSTKLIKLPEKYSNLSDGGGEIVVDKEKILFYTNRGVLDGFSGFVYSPGDKQPKNGDFGGDIKKIERLIKTGIL
ncbi:MAG: hypothetical protein K0Q49_2437 [Haloplasmataceae bacterium]|jgi:energy-coupling factor transporter transmembrane protein EcfT|nr:hypothetical protein [Haloplasmataceae bacterium]